MFVGVRQRKPSKTEATEVYSCLIHCKRLLLEVTLSCPKYLRSLRTVSRVTEHLLPLHVYLTWIIIFVFIKDMTIMFLQ